MENRLTTEGETQVKRKGKKRKIFMVGQGVSEKDGLKWGLCRWSYLFKSERNELCGFVEF